MGLDFSVTKKQRLFLDSDADETLFGGAAGGGKSWCVCLSALLTAIKYPGSKQLVMRRSYPELERSIIRTVLEMYPKDIYSYNSSKHTMNFKNGSLIDFGYAENMMDIYRYQGLEFDTIIIDEATHFEGEMVDYLRSRLRGANDIPKRMLFTSNPGGTGHQYFKSRFVDVCVPEQKLEVTNPRTGRTSTRLYIPARVYDNPFLLEKDPYYIERLEELPEEQRKALLEGSWDLFSGQFFPEFSRDLHVIKDRPKLDDTYRVYFTCDYGLDAFCGHFIAVDRHEYCYVLGEVYSENTIISDAAKMAKARQKELHITKVDEWLAPTDLWNRRQETGKSVADIFRDNGITLRKASRDRISGWVSVKELLKPFKDEQDIKTAKLKIHESCVNLIMSLPALQYDANRPGDAAVKPHEYTHSTDSLRYFAVYRFRPNKEKRKQTEDELMVERGFKEFNSNSMYDIYGGKHGDDSDYYNSVTNWSF